MRNLQFNIIWLVLIFTGCVHGSMVKMHEESTVLINRFEVKDQQQFVDLWQEANEYLKQQDGYIYTRLHQNKKKPGEWINYALWENPVLFQKAVNSPGFLAIKTKFKKSGIKPQPALYQIKQQDFIWD